MHVPYSIFHIQYSICHVLERCCILCFMADNKPKAIAFDLVNELKKVSWPSREKTIRLTVIVIIISLIIGFYIGIIDFLLARGLKLLTK